jgi:hypothetical protein
MVATNGMLSMTADRIAETPQNDRRRHHQIAAGQRHELAAHESQKAARLDRVHHHEQTDEKEDRRPFDLGKGRMHMIRLPAAAMLQIVEQHEHCGAGKRDGRRLEMQRAREDERGQHRREHRDRAAQQHPIGHHAGRIHAHDKDAAFLAGVQRASPDQVNKRRLHRHHQQRGRRDIGEEGVEIEARLRADQDIGRVADQGRGAADVGGEHFRKQKRKGRQLQLLGDHQRDRHHEKNGADIVEHRRENGRRQLQHEQNAGRIRPHPLRRHDCEVLKQPRAA